MFSCSAEGFWEVIELPVRVSSQVVIEPAPHVRQLESVLDEYERFCLLLADSQRARVFVVELGELIERTDVFDADEEVRHQHLRHAAEVTFRLFQDEPFDHLAVGAPPEIAAEITASLHPYLRERLVDRISLSVQASDDQVRRAALDVERTVERRKEQALVRRLRDAVGAGRRGVGGLEQTLHALVGAAGRASARVAGVSGTGMALPPVRLPGEGRAALPLVQRAHGADVRCRRTCD